MYTQLLTYTSTVNLLQILHFFKSNLYWSDVIFETIDK